MYKADELEQQSTDIEDKCLRRTQSTVSATPGVPRQMVQNEEPSINSGTPCRTKTLGIWSLIVADLRPLLHTRTNDYAFVAGDALSNEIG